MFVLLFTLTCVSAAEKTVLFAMDDFQVWWLEDIQESIVQVHIDNNIPVTLGVIPEGITDPWGAGDRIIARIQKWDAYPNIEVAQHGYDHVPYFEDEDYNTQYSQIKMGNDLMMSIGDFPKSFIPPFGSANLDTVNVLKALGFHTLYNPVEMDPTQSNDVLIIQDQIILCRGGDEGKNCVYKDYNVLKSEIDQKINQYGVALVLYHMQDFNKGTDNSPIFDTYKSNQIVNYASQLKQDGYTLMTVEQYYQHLNNPTPEVVDNDKDGYDTTVDCNDNDASIHPGALDNNCNNIDENCNGQIDENYIQTITNCGVGACASTGQTQCVNGAIVNTCTSGTPIAEVCNNQIDDDCDGLVDLADLSDCQLQPVCGNNIIEGAETCDSNLQSCTINGYSGTQSCNSQCSGWNTCITTQSCGDGQINGNEQCDVGNQNGIVCSPLYGGSCSYCSSQCENTIVQGDYCGDKIIQLSYEQCDDGNAINGDGCNSSCKTEIPPAKTMILYPNGQGYRRGWQNVNCGSDFNEWKCVDETVPNANDYLKNSGIAKETFTFSNTGLLSEKINSITLFYYARWDNFQSNSCFEAMIRYKGIDYLSGNQMCVTNSWKYVSYTYTKNPGTNLPWTIAEVEALEAGMHSLDPNGGGRVSQIYALVEYTI